MLNRTLSLLVSLSIVFTPFVAYSQNTATNPGVPDVTLDLRIISLDEGEVAPFTGILLTTDSLTKMQLEFEKKVKEMEIQARYNEERYQLHLGSLGEKLQQESIFRRNEIELRDSYIEDLEEKYLEKDNLSPWWMIGSFAMGCLTTIAIAYSLQGAYK